VHYRWLGVFLALVVMAAQGGQFLRDFWPPPLRTEQGKEEASDYFQDWVSARNVLHGKEAYPKLKDWLNENLSNNPDRFVYVERNAHPPSSILLVLPFGNLDYQTSYLLWGLSELLCFVLAFWLIGRELSLRWSPQLLVMVAGVCLFCGPLRQQVMQGQFNGLLLLLLAATWRDSRRSHPMRAGVWLALATAIKLYPGFLFLHFLLRGQWRLVFTGTAVFLAITAVTWAVLGLEAFRTYVTEVMPLVSQCRAGWPNVSVTGWWSKLFDAGNGYDASRLELLWPAPTLCRVGILLSTACVLGVWLWGLLRTWKIENLEQVQYQEDLRFCLSLFAMSLVSPITWDHYLLIMLLPLLVMSRRLALQDKRAWLLAFLAAVCCISPPLLQQMVGMSERTPAQPWQTLTVLSLHCYVLLLWFGLNLHLLRASGNARKPA
jgi:hypothetical protein